MRFGVADSALKPGRGISYSDVVFVANNGDYIGIDIRGRMWWLGTTEAGLDIEVAGFVPPGDPKVIILHHSFPMKWRKR